MSQETPHQIYYRKFSDKDNSSIYAKVIWKENENDIFKIQIFEGDISWSGRFSREFGKQFSENTDNDEEDYYKNVKISLTEESTDPQNQYVYEFTKSEPDSAKFTWKLKLGPTDTMIHGTVPVHKDEQSKNTFFLLDSLIKQNGELITKANELQKANKYMSEELEKYKNEMKGFVNAKSLLEKTMYGKFVNLLNTKKRRISLLEQNIKTISSQSEVD